MISVETSDSVFSSIFYKEINIKLLLTLQKFWEQIWG